MGADMKANAWVLGGGGALEVGDHRLLEDGSKRGGALGSDVVASETESEGQDGNSERVVSMGADRKANTQGLVRGRAAYSSDCSVELPLRPSARAAPPSGPRQLLHRLRAWEQRWVLRCVKGR